MEIYRPETQNRHRWIFNTDIQVDHMFERQGEPFPTSLYIYEGMKLRSRHARRGDGKAMQMYRMYASHSLQLSWEARRVQLLLLNWVVYNSIQKKVKRAFDLLVVLCALPFVLPIMLLAAVGIKLDSPGPVFFRQERVGQGGRRFTCYKFRSMCMNAESRKEELMSFNEADEVIFKIKHDPRITRFGHIIRKLSIDELPQIFNVIKGDMSIVGPRPPVPCEVAEYQFDTYRRLDAIPGITGLQQVSGRSNLSFKRWVECDIEYIQKQSLRKDIEIILKTIPTVISGKGAY